VSIEKCLTRGVPKSRNADQVRMALGKEGVPKASPASPNVPSRSEGGDRQTAGDRAQDRKDARSRPICFTIPRPPVAKARPRVVRTKGGVRTFTPAKTRRFELDVAAIASEYVVEPIDGPVAVDILAILPRPKRLMRKKDPEGFLWHDKRPDADNIRKAVLDGLQTALRDDAQVCAGKTVKVYAEKTGQPRTVVRIRRLQPVTDRNLVRELPEWEWAA